uniref:UV excision repair protein RAD23 n=1 Tax=Aceria tosichella TaxID=561515 RepID=A0A6G1S8H4_9ACAR
MKLTIKTLQNSTFKVDIEPDRTVKELKETIEKEQGKDYPSSSQKLIYNGKILADENKLAEYEFDEKKFVVLMITRPPPLPKPAATNEQIASSNKQKKDDKPKNSMAAPPPPPPTTTAAATTTTTTRQPQTASSSTVSSTPTSVTPATTTTASSPATQQPVSSARSTNFTDASGSPMNDTQARLATLMRQAQFRQMQDLIQQSPHLLSSTIESLAASDPEMYNFISENPDVFVNALNHPPMADTRSNQQSGGAQRTSSQGRSGGAQQSGGQPPVVDQLLVNVSEHDKEAIERLKELGFSEYLAVQAYMACDKDEQLAANLLFQMDQ